VRYNFNALPADGFALRIPCNIFALGCFQPSAVYKPSQGIYCFSPVQRFGRQRNYCTQRMLFAVFGRYHRYLRPAPDGTLLFRRTARIPPSSVTRRAGR
jgi:hypothetical protein